MALGKYSRIDVRKSSTSYCSTVTFVVFVGLCLVGVWMMTSSSIVPVQNVDETTQESKNEVQTQLKEASKTSTDDDDTSIDNNPNTEGNTSSDANSNSDQSNTSSDNNLNTESNTSSTSNLNSESNTSNDSKEESSTSDSESNTDSDGTRINTDGESSKSVSAQSTSGSNTNSDGTKTNTDSTIEGTSGSNTDIEGSTNSDSTGGSSKSNESDQPKQFADNPGDLPDDATKGDNVTVSSNAKSSSQPEKTTSEHPADDNQETKPLNQQSREEDTNREKGSKSDTGNEQDKKEDGVSGTKNKESNDGEKKSETDEKKHIDEKTYGAEISDEPQNKSKAEDKIEVKKADEIAGEKKELLPSGAQSELLNETVTGDRAWKTQAAQSQKEADKSSEPSENTGSAGWKLCNVTTGADYIPCLDNMQAIKKLRTTKHYEHRERHCPDEPPTCLVLLPEGYQRSVEWPTSREKIWYHNVPHTELAKFKGHQNWVKLSGEYLTFPGGGTQFMHGALHYIDFIQQIAPDIAWGKRSRVVLDVGCGVASFGGFLFDRDTLTMSFAPKDEHEAQVQFALERGIPAFLAVMGTKRLPFPGRVFDIVHCARCRVPWHIEGGKLLLELNRLLRPGGYFVWSATPVYQKETEDVQIWEAMKKLLKAMCWEVVSIGKDRINKVGIAIFQKPSTNECYERRSEKEPPLCNDSDDPNASWNVPLQACMHKIPVGETERGSKWPELWPERVQKPPYWLLSSQVGVYGKPAPDDFVADYEHWKRVVTKSYVTGMGINWSMVRNVMDMKAIYGGFAAALREMNVWVMNVVNIDSPDTLPIIYERGLFGMYHDWCESFNTYPRTYDLIHADHLFSKIKKNCNFEALVAEVDRILRPEGKLIVRDKAETIRELDTMFKSMQWEVRMTYAKDKEGLLCVKKSIWRPTETITLPYAICPKGDCDRTRYN